MAINVVRSIVYVSTSEVDSDRCHQNGGELFRTFTKAIPRNRVRVKQCQLATRPSSRPTPPRSCCRPPLTRLVDKGGSPRGRGSAERMRADSPRGAADDGRGGVNVSGKVRRGSQVADDNSPKARYNETTSFMSRKTNTSLGDQ